MNNYLLKLAIIIILLVPKLYAGNPVYQTSNGITITAHVMSAKESKGIFNQDLRSHHIYPVHLSFYNKRDKPIYISPQSAYVVDAHMLTSASLKSSISKTSLGALFLTLLFFPLGALMWWHLNHLTELLSIVEKYDMSDKTIKLYPGDNFETFVFPEFSSPDAEYLRDEQGNKLRDEQGKELPAQRPPFVEPKFLEITIKFLIDKAWFNSVIRFNIPV